MSCLSSGVPIVAIPITTDQPGMAARVARVGAGEVVPLSKLTVTHLKTAIERVLGQGKASQQNHSYRDSAEEIRLAIKAAGGVNQAANIVEQVISTSVPVLSSQVHSHT